MTIYKTSRRPGVIVLVSVAYSLPLLSSSKTVRLFTRTRLAGSGVSPCWPAQSYFYFCSFATMLLLDSLALFTLLVLGFESCFIRYTHFAGKEKASF